MVSQAAGGRGVSRAIGGAARQAGDVAGRAGRGPPRAWSTASGLLRDGSRAPRIRSDQTVLIRSRTATMSGAMACLSAPSAGPCLRCASTCCLGTVRDEAVQPAPTLPAERAALASLRELGAVDATRESRSTTVTRPRCAPACGHGQAALGRSSA